MKVFLIILIFQVSSLNLNLLLVNQYVNVEAQESEEEKEIFEEEELIFSEHHRISPLLSTIFYLSSYDNYEDPSLLTLTRPPKFST